MIKKVLFLFLFLNVVIQAKEFKSDYFIISYSKDIKHANNINDWCEEIIYHLNKTLNISELSDPIKIKYNSTKKHFPKSILINDQIYYTFKGGWYDNSSRKVYLSNHRNPFGVQMKKWTCSMAVSKALFHVVLKLKPSASYNGPIWFEEGFSLYLAGLNDLSSEKVRSVFLASIGSFENDTLVSSENLLKLSRNEFNQLDESQKFIFQSQIWSFISFLIKNHKSLILASIKEEEEFDLKGLKEKILKLKNLDSRWKFFIKAQIKSELESVSKNNDKEIKKMSEKEVPDVYSFIIELKTLGRMHQESWLKRIIHPSRIGLKKDLLKLVKNKDSIVRWMAVRSMGLYHNRKVISDLINITIYDRDLEVRKEAANAIRILNFDVLPSAYYLLMKKPSVSMTSLRNMAKAVSIIGDPDGVNQLVSILKLKQSKLISSSEFTTSRAYIVDYDVDDGILHPVIKNYKVGHISETRTVGLSNLTQDSILLSIQNLSYESNAKSFKELIKWYKDRKH
ncbi:MAG: hypothetical protein COA79_24875 [Planctomycetota bacterium]|nr:MAG: hypothetical protein COA79_24875 [Planctomycetota bacterium]